MMVKKRVPDWLNSSIWSSPQPPPDYAVKLAPAPIVEPPPPVTPPDPPSTSSVHASSAAKRGIRDPLSSNYGSNTSVCYSDEENGSSSANSTASVGGAAAAPPAAEIIARQAQLLQEVFLSLSLSLPLSLSLKVFVQVYLTMHLAVETIKSLARQGDTRWSSCYHTEFVLSRKVINMGELRRLASQGIPDGAGIRATVWKLLLGYLPSDRSLWPSELAKKEIMRRLEKSSLENYEPDSSKGFLSRSEITHGEHPLSLGKSSIWNQFFQDAEIIEQIDRDVKRTHPDIHFFSGDSTFAKSNQVSPISFSYVQGMNEILAPLFYVFKNDPNEDNAASAEADTFFCFVELLSGFRDNFVQQLDNSVVGIRSTITRLSRLLKEHDEELWRHLEMTTKVNPQFYAFRWITLLLTQEFNFADILLIWDTLLSDPDGPQETLIRICCAMLIIVRKRLLAGDFTSNLKLLQSYPSTNISHLLYVANKLRVHLAG
ncbi:hypothetical protein DH2020_043404 [Rehmannia glutinosa]|uniref:Rab-GAP TBC domain-containing protein n=1 Tax=Rehmannia glutinosa TaxID=99300 RepID=A0ABR0UJU9_REHGL